jgi:hypothetical protein
MQNLFSVYVYDNTTATARETQNELIGTHIIFMKVANRHVPSKLNVPDKYYYKSPLINLVKIRLMGLNLFHAYVWMTARTTEITLWTFSRDVNTTTNEHTIGLSRRYASSQFGGHYAAI